MAKKKTPPAPPTPTPDRVRAAVRTGDFLTAVDVAKKLHTLTPTPENLAVRKEALAAAAAHYADRGAFADFNRVMTEAATLGDEPEWVTDRAVLLARGGVTADALRLIANHPDAAARGKVLAAAADRAVRRQVKEFLPEELHSGYDSIVAAFRNHEAGNEAAAREALEPVGLRSPFLEWKVLLRGLLAYAANDDARAAENFARLDPTRLPARLAAPLRCVVDPAYKATLPADAANALHARAQKLTTSPVVDALRVIAQDLGRDKPLAPAFRAAEVAVPLLKQTAPHLVPRLANCLYHAIIHQGQPDDLPRFRKLFGNPPNDPNFHKVHAVVGEAIGDRAGAHAHWQKFEQWLATNPPGWPASLLTRARAEVWARLGENARKALDMPPVDLFGAFTFVRQEKKPKPLDPPADACYRRAAELDPDWPDAVRLLFEWLVEMKKPADAEAVARDFLTRQPENLPALEALANLVQSQGRTDDAATLRLKVLAINPLDKPTRFKASVALLGSARRKLADGHPADAEVIFDQHRLLLEEQFPAGFAALQSVVCTRLGKPDEATQLRAKALAVPNARLGTAYRMMVDAQLAKLKPGDKRPVDKLFAEELAKPVTPAEVAQVIVAYDCYHIEGLTYRGQKTHEKKLLDLTAKCLAAAAPEVDFEQLGDLLVIRQQWKHAKKYLDGCRLRFPNNPCFLVLAAETSIGKGERLYNIDRILLQAKRLVEASTEPRHRPLLDKIARLQKEIDTPFGFGDIFGDFE